MEIKKIITPKRIVCFLVLTIMAIFIARSDIYIDSVRAGLNLYVACVLPATFPFFFFSKLLTELDFAKDLNTLTEKPLAKIFHAKPVAGYILIMSLLCGYPIGAKLLSEFFCAGMIDREDAKKISAFTSTGSPIFIIGTVGVALFHNKTYGFLLLASHYLATFCNGLLYRRKKISSSSLPLSGAVGGDLLNKSMTETFLAVGLVGGFIVLTNMLIDMADRTGLFAPFIYLCSLLNISSRVSSSLLCGLMEMTRGCKMFSSYAISPSLALPCCAFLVTFGGISITLQSMSYLSKIKISPAYYLLTKGTQGMLSAVIMLLLCLLFRL